MKIFLNCFAIFFGLLFFNFSCESNNQIKRDKHIITIYSTYTVDNVRFIQKKFKYGDSIICVSHSTDVQLLSIKIADNNLFKRFRDTMDFQSDRLIGLQIFGYHCGYCHDSRSEKVVSLFQEDAEFKFLLLDKNHKKSPENALNSDEIYFIRSYLNSVK